MNIMHESVKDFQLLLGQFVTTSSNILAIDPCYDEDLGTVISNAALGKWSAFVAYSDEKIWGRRVASIEIYHDDFRVSHLLDSRWKSYGHDAVGVDSGQAGFFQLERYQENGKGDFNDKDSFYGKVCDLTLSNEQCGLLEYGAVSSSGFGDGGYELQTIEKDGQTVAARIIFISKEEEEDDK